MLAVSKHWMTLQAWLQVTVMAIVGACRTGDPAVAMAQAEKAQHLGAFTVSWISHQDWPPSVSPSHKARQV